MMMQFRESGVDVFFTRALELLFINNFLFFRFSSWRTAACKLFFSSLLFIYLNKFQFSPRDVYFISGAIGVRCHPPRSEEVLSVASVRPFFTTSLMFAPLFIIPPTITELSVLS